MPDGFVFCSERFEESDGAGFFEYDDEQCADDGESRHCEHECEYDESIDVE